MEKGASNSSLYSDQLGGWVYTHVLHIMVGMGRPYSTKCCVGPFTRHDDTMQTPLIYKVEDAEAYISVAGEVKVVRMLDVIGMTSINTSTNWEMVVLCVG